jgi:hypothetical protein
VIVVPLRISKFYRILKKLTVYAGLPAALMRFPVPTYRSTERMHCNKGISRISRRQSTNPGHEPQTWNETGERKAIDGSRDTSALSGRSGTTPADPTSDIDITRPFDGEQSHTLWNEQPQQKSTPALE